MRVVQNEPRFVYAWTVNDREDQILYLQIGVNGIIADLSSIPQLVSLLEEPEFQQRYYLATRPDNPFLPSNAAYGLTIHTSDINMAGTDAMIKFALVGDKSSSWITVNTKVTGRMERGDTNYVVLPSPDLGRLKTLTVQRDNSGNAPDWHLQSITVQSQRYKVNTTATFDCWIDNTEPFSRPFN